MSSSPHTPSIHVLDDDSLINVFYLYRPCLLGEDDDDEDHFKGGRPWVEECWWYKLAHVCQRWRNTIFGSASYLGLSLVATKGTPVADMLAHSPSFPLVIDYFEGYYGDITTEDEDGAIFALKQRDRVRRVRLFMRITNLQKLLVAIDKEYPILEYLIVMNRSTENTTPLMFPEALHAPHLRHLALVDITLPIGSRLLTTAVRLVTLCLVKNNAPIYFHPNTLLQWLSFTPQLETLMIGFIFNAQILTPMPVMSPVALPNLRHFHFRDYSAYLEALVHLITPFPEKLDIRFVIQPTYSLPRLLQFINTTEYLKFKSVKFKFSMFQASVAVYPRGDAEIYALSIAVDCYDFDLQVSSVVQICNSLSQIFSAVEHLTFEPDGWSSGGHNAWIDIIEWRRLLSSFSNVKTFRIDNVFVNGVSRCLELDDGELSLELLPELQELAYSGSDKTGDVFASFIDARQKAGHPITLTR